MSDFQLFSALPRLIDVSAGTADTEPLPFPITLSAPDAAPINSNADIGALLEQLDSEVTYIEVNMVAEDSDPQALEQLYACRTKLELAGICYHAGLFRQALAFADALYNLVESVATRIELVDQPSRVSPRLDWQAVSHY